jgi:pyridoxamine 5'-phosphate oxidase
MTAATDPFDRFRDLFERASATGLTEPNAMVVSSADEQGRPSSRVVLLKHFDHQGFVFYTNLESRKGREILARPDVSLNLFWREPKEQVCVFGRAERVADEEADAYFASRDRNSQLGAWASQQSRPLESREQLVVDFEQVTERFAGREVPRPPHWTGLRVVPRRFEFWVAREHRLHDRTFYERDGDAWRTGLLYP